MKEDLLHYFWRIKKWSGLLLETTNGVKCEVIHSGDHNSNSGPDFLNAKIKIGDTVWSGNVEMHILSSDWLVHNHQEDAIYNSVILHVVWKHDREINYKDNSIIPCIEISKFISPRILNQYDKLLNNGNWIPCENLLTGIEKLKIDTWLSRMLLEKLEEKYESIIRLLNKNKGDWEETFHQWLARGFGLNINAEPFEMLANNLPLNLLAKLQDKPLQLEALAFGQAGLLPESSQDEYITKLISEYQYLKQKYSLTPIIKGVFKFFRVRPANFPVLRIVQWISFLRNHMYTWQYVKELTSPDKIMDSLRIELEGYWRNHYTFDPEIKKNNTTAGEDFTNLIVINAIGPFIYAYGKKNNELSYQEKALDFIESLKPESNTIIKQWNSLGISSENAAQTQGLLFLKKNYCDKKKCLQCSIGHYIMNPVI